MADTVSRVGWRSNTIPKKYYTNFGEDHSSISTAAPRQFHPSPLLSDDFSLLAYNGFLNGKHDDTSSQAFANREVPGRLRLQSLTITHYLSIGVFLLHMVAAFGHILHLLLTRYSSASRDTVEESVVLAQVSRTDTKDLKNTSEGIKRVPTMASNTRVRTSGSGAGGGRERV